MARATSHGAAAAAGPDSSSNHFVSSAGGRRHSNNSNSNNNSGDDEEATNPLLPGGGGGEHTGDNGDDADDGLIVRPGSPHDEDDTNDHDNQNNHHHHHHHHNNNNNRSFRAPRTPNRVRFDLRPTIVDDGPGRNHADHDDDSNTDTRYNPRESFDVDNDEADDALAGHHGTHHQQRVPLLTGIEAPSVTVAETLSAEEDAESWAAAERARPKSSLPAAFMNMANSIIGAGIIGQPYAFRQAGLLSGVVLLVVLTAAVDWTIRLIVVNSKLSGAGSFQGTVERCFGRTGLVAVSLAQWAFAFGGMVAFGVIVGDSIPSVLRAIWPGLRDMPVLGLLADRRAVIIVFTMAVSYPLALYRDIAKLAKASTLALVSMAVIVITVVVQGAMAPAEARGSLKDWRLLVINDGIFQAIGVISFAFVCHHNSLLIYGSLEKPTIDRFAKVTHISTGVSMVACLLMALSGFLTFGDRTQGNVLNNFPPDNTMVNIARLCFGLNMLTTLPLEAFVCREVMLNYYFPGEPFNMNLHLIFTSSLVFSAMVLSLLTCDLGSVFDLVGGTSAAAMAYILPPLCYIKLTTRSWRTYVAWAVAAFGCVVMVMSMLQAIARMIRGEGDTRQCY
ncbi:transmembrane amino acid transporter protein-domain-containing protein [Thermothelomyces heterothallicus CBS 202.75]|uniref:transmembrane amino acid transporter protein-domain-containing protein n=1 Tax=Thermothelomyces heterothallicus CBS 202.75 TaxID=1149848 RepID=UPI0037441417